MDSFVSWFNNHTMLIFLISGLVLVGMLLLRRFRIEDFYDRIAARYAEKKTAAYARKHPESSTILLDEYKIRRHSSCRTILSLPLTIISFIAVITLIVSLALIWQARQGEDDVTGSAIQSWLTEHGLAIVIIFFVAYLLTSMLQILIPKIILRIIESRRSHTKLKTSQEEYDKRSKTIARVLINTINVIIWIVAIFTALSNIGLDITPLLTSAGIAGLAVSLGAQSLIKDVIAGFFILLEGHYNVGDYITIAGVSGTVTDINFRRTTLRALNGALYSVPNGQITISTNYTNEIGKIYFTVPISYDSDIDLAESTINRVGQELAADKRFKKSTKSPIKFIRVENLGDSSIDMLVSGETVAGQQWTIAGAFRKQLKKAFDEAGIDIPYTHMNVIIENKETAVDLAEE